MKKIDDEYLEKFGADDEYSLQDIHEYKRKDLYKYDVEYLREMVKYMHSLFELRKKQIEEFKAKAKETSETEWQRSNLFLLYLIISKNAESRHALIFTLCKNKHFTTMSCKKYKMN